MTSGGLFAKLAHKGKAALEQIQLSLGHASVQTTERLPRGAGLDGRALRPVGVTGRGGAVTGVSCVR